MQDRILKDQFMLRLPDGLRETIKERAKAAHRSMNSEIIFQLSNAYEEKQNEKSGTTA